MRIAPRICLIESIEELNIALRALTLIDVHQMRSGSFPALYSSGIRYAREKRDAQGNVIEDWRTAKIVAECKWGDCEDLSCYLAGEYIIAGVNAEAFGSVVGPRLVHIRVRLPDGTIEDPSAQLGMLGDG